MSEEKALLSGKMSPNDLRPDSFNSKIWIARVNKDIPVEDVLKPQFWAHVAGEIAQCNAAWRQINVVWKDNSKVALLYVRDAGGESVLVEVLELYEFENAADFVVPEEYSVDHHDSEKWRVVRIKDHQLIRNGFATQSAAVEFINKTLKTGT